MAALCIYSVDKVLIVSNVNGQEQTKQHLANNLLVCLCFAGLGAHCAFRFQGGRSAGTWRGRSQGDALPK